MSIVIDQEKQLDAAFWTAQAISARLTEECNWNEALTNIANDVHGFYQSLLSRRPVVVFEPNDIVECPNQLAHGLSFDFDIQDHEGVVLSHVNGEVEVQWGSAVVTHWPEELRLRWRQPR